MRRDTVISAADRVVTDLTDSGVDTMFDKAIEKFRDGGITRADERSSISFEVFRKYSITTANYGEAEIEVCKILELDLLLAAATWEKLANAPDPGFLFEWTRKIEFAKTHLPKVVKLFRQEHVIEAKTGGPLPKELEGRTAITFILPEDAHEYSTPGRLVAALDAITSIYSVFCTIEGQSETDLIVLACDSGSDKSFDFLGLAKMMEQVRKFVIAIWDRRVFYRHMHASQCIALIAQSLPVVERIEELKRSKTIDPEQAELLKRKTLQGATMFLESGIYIDEMAHETNHSPRQLMRPAPKLLAAPQPSPTASAISGVTKTEHLSPSISSSSPDALTPEEAAVLRHLLDKASSQANEPAPQAQAKSRRRKKMPDA
jgi:hypothetical protein